MPPTDPKSPADPTPPAPDRPLRAGPRPDRPVSRRIGFVLGWIGVAVLAGAVWSMLAPTPEGTVVNGTVRYPSLDDPVAVLHAQYVVITGVGGLLTGVVTLGLGTRGLARRTVVNLLAGLGAAALTYAVGFLLGPPTQAAQLAAGRETVLPALVLTTPLLVLVWPMATSLVVTIGTLLSLVISPPRRPGEP